MMNSILISISLSLALYSLLLHRIIKVGDIGSYGYLSGSESDIRRGNRALAWAILLATLAR